MLVAVLALAALLAPAPAAAAAASDAELRSLPAVEALPSTTVRRLPKHRMLFGQVVTWQQALRWRYNHAGAPAALANDSAAVVRELQATFAQWTGSCGIEQVYDGETATPPNQRVGDPLQGDQPDGENVVGWGSPPGGGAGLTYAWYRSQPDGSRAFIDVDIVLSPAFVTSTMQVRRTSVHEWGHALGLAHSNFVDALMSGPPATPYNMLLAPTADDVRGCRCLYGPAATQPAGYSCSLPEAVSIGDVVVGVPTTRALPFTNAGNAPLAIAAIAGATAELSVSGCVPGTSIAPGESCTLAITAQLAAEGSRSVEIGITASDGWYRLPVVASAAVGSGVGATADVIEYYRADIDHYFMSSLNADITALDSGRLPGWSRTGRSFKAHPSAQPGTVPVCRFYLPPPYGDSHFYGRDPRECDATRAANPGFTFEAPDVMHLYPAVAGVCPGATVPVYRVFNARIDTNHRYTSDRALRDAMVRQGWVAEGDGPAVVLMCAPQ